MIRKFSVKNFKGFKNEISLDLSKTRDYSFNSNLVKNGIVFKGLIYGKNGSGKSNLGFAIYDLTIHLTDKQKPNPIYYLNYLNLNQKTDVAVFNYEFMFDNKVYTYSYAKNSFNSLVFEEISCDDKTILYYDYNDKNKIVMNIPEAESLNINLPDNKLSILKYIYRNTPSNDSIISKIVKFAEGMLWFRCVNDGNSFIGLMSGGSSMDEIIIQNNKMKDFENFLHSYGLDYKLDFRNVNGQNILVARFDNGEASFDSIASTGTKALWLYYCWSLFFKNVTFLYMDEFDAFYHFECSEMVLKAINDNKNMQALVTSHNTYLMKNSLTRPDCCFIISDGKIASLCDCTEKEIRLAHNLEKMYRNGAFEE